MVVFKQAQPQFRHVFEVMLRGTRLTAFWNDLLGNSGHLLILKILSEISIVGWQKFITDPITYLLIGAMLAQSAYLSKAASSRLFGNLIGVGIYTCVDFAVEGLEFFQDSSHAVFWVFSLAIGMLQSIHFHWKSALERWTIPLENIVRMFMVLAYYLVVRTSSDPVQPPPLARLQELMFKNSHAFLAASMIIVGLLLGFQQLQIITQQRQLEKKSMLFQNLAKWGMGSYALSTAVMHPEQLDFRQCERAIVFMDIRRFTAWCEQTEPSIVASTLNRYYQQVEPVVFHYQPLRITLTADEIMAIYATPEQAVNAAQAMQRTAKDVLSPHGIGAGCAVHYGTVVEGLFGGENVRTYTVIGDVVNAAKRLESATPAGEVTISDVVYRKLNGKVEIKHSRNLKLKGKTEPFKGWVLQNQ